jgi:hypothetical protein
MLSATQTYESIFDRDPEDLIDFKLVVSER